MELLSTLLISLMLTQSPIAAARGLCSPCKCTTAPLSRDLLDCSHLDLDSLPSSPIWDTYFNTTPDVASLPTTLDLSYNKITKLRQPPSIWESVTELCLRHNGIDDVAESAFINLKNLRLLDLSHNKITSDVIRADVFRGAFDNVRYEPLPIVVLDLGYNEIHSLGSRALEHMPNLVELRLNNNPFVVLDAATEMALAMPKALVKLNLAYTGLSDLPETLMHGIRSIEELYLNGNNLNTVPESLAVVGESLQKLNLNDNPMTSLDQDSFLGLVNLRQLNVSACARLTHVLPATFSTQFKLESLHLSFNYNLSYVDMDAFRALKKQWPITELYLHHNALPTLPRDLLPWDKLQVADLQGNPWRCDCETRWMLTEVVRPMARVDPDHVVDLRCHEPFELRGKQLIALTAAAYNESLDCTATQNRPPRLPRHSRSSSVFITVISMLTVAVCVSAVVLMVSKKLCSGRSQHRFVQLKDVRYTRE